MSAGEIEAIQEHCFQEDLRRLGPSIFRSLETWALGHEALRGSASQLLRKKAESFAREIRKALPGLPRRTAAGLGAGRPTPDR